MDWVHSAGTQSFLIAAFLTALPMWFGMATFRANLLAWLVSPVIGAALAGGVMLLLMALPPPVGKSIVLLLITCIAVGFVGGLVTAKVAPGMEE